jgi:hypothetical protein
MYLRDIYKSNNINFKALIDSGGVWCYAADLIRNCWYFTSVRTITEVKTELGTQTYALWNYNQRHEASKQTLTKGSSS